MADAKPQSKPASRLSVFARALIRPASVGGLYFLALSATALASTLGDDRVQGVSAPSVRHLIATRFRNEITDASLVSLAVAVLIGLTLGGLAGWVVQLKTRLLGRPPKSARELALPALGVLVVIHGFAWFYDLAQHPQAYAPAFYAEGGARAALQVVVADWLGPKGVAAIGVVCALAYFARPVRRFVAARPRFMTRKLSAAVAAIVLTAVALIALWPLAGSRVAHAESSRPNVLIIAADSLRSDRLERRVAPNLTSLAERGTRFDRAYVSLPRTFPSWVTILSGRDPHHHGVRTMFPRREERTADVGAIPRRLADAGYHTAVVSDFAGDIFRRMDFGFAHTLAPTFNVRELVREVVIGGQSPILPLLRTRAASRRLPVLRELHDTTDPFALTSDALDEIDRSGGKPFFVVAFYSTTHFPYSAPAPYWSRYLERGYSGPYRYGKTPSLAAEGRPSDADVRAVRALYDGAVAAVDDAAAELVAGLKKRGLDRSTIIVITSDHGETLYEPGRGQGHGDHLFGDEAVHVPLVVIDPRHPGTRRVSELVRSTDIAPTLCELLAVDCAARADGRSLVPAILGQPLAARPAFAETELWFTRDIPDVPASLRMPYPDLTGVLEVDSQHDGELVVSDKFTPLVLTAKHRMLREDRYKLIYIPTRDAVRYVLFDTLEDPLETHDLAAEKPDVVRRLRDELWRWMLEDPAMRRSGERLVPNEAQP